MVWIKKAEEKDATVQTEHQEEKESSTLEPTQETNRPIKFRVNEAELIPLNGINSTYLERNISLSQDGNTLYFMSNRGGQSWSQLYSTFKGMAIHDGDIWVSNKINGSWQMPTVLPQPLSSSQGEDEPNISTDGNRLYFQSWDPNWTEKGGPYYMVEKKDGEWLYEEEQPLGGEINQFFRTHNATDGMTISRSEDIFIVASGRDYEGNMDIYMSRKGSLGWSRFVKLDLNTDLDERSVFLADDGKTLYFASNGYGDKGYGGLDIYKTTIDENGGNSEIINIGEPFNTPGDDLGFVISSDKTTAYFIQDGDIIQANLIKVDPKILP